MNIKGELKDLLTLLAPSEILLMDIVTIVERLAKSYSEPWRRYHTLDNHISHFLDEFNRNKNLITDPFSFELAIFYHDIVYLPGGIYNEEASVDRALYDLTFLNYNEKNQVRDLILGEKLSFDAIDLDFFIDMDYSILGDTEDSYKQYMLAIYNEYRLVPGFKIGRANFLQKLLDRPYIYRTDLYRLSHENAARKNIINELMYGRDFIPGTLMGEYCYGYSS